MYRKKDRYGTGDADDDRLSRTVRARARGP